jgi:hypothetical protein
MGRKIHTAWTGPLLINTANVVQTKFPRGVGVGSIFDSAAFDVDFASNLSLVDSVSGNNLIDFTRSSTATYVDSAGVIQDVAIDAPRFDHDFDTLESLGLLVEDASTNKIKYSEDFDLPTTNWTTTDAGTTSLSGVLSPDGVTYMSLIDLSAVAGSVSSGSRVYHTGLGFNTSDQTFSFYARSVSGTGTFPVGYYNGSAYIKEYVTLTETTKRYTMIVPSSVSTGDILGWTRRGDTQLETLDQALVWGAQFEDVAYPSSYIRSTSGTSVTRSADVASITGTNFSDWYNQGEGTVLANVGATSQSAVSAGRPFMFHDGTTNNRIGSNFAFSSTFNLFYSQGGNSPVDLGNIPGLPKPILAAIAYKSGDYRGAYDGNLTLTDSTAAVPAVNTLSLGYQGYSSAAYHNGHIKRITYWSTRLSDSDMITVTT